MSMQGAIAHLPEDSIEVRRVGIVTLTNLGVRTQAVVEHQVNHYCAYKK